MIRAYNHLYLQRHEINWKVRGITLPSNPFYFLKNARIFSYFYSLFQLETLSSSYPTFYLLIIYKSYYIFTKIKFFTIPIEI